MKSIERINLIDKIAVKLQQKFTYDHINLFLADFEVNPEYDDGRGSKRLYVIERLKGVSVSELKKIADELEIDTYNLVVIPPKNWVDPNTAKAFISHVAKDKNLATRIRDVFLEYNVNCFVAHEDIKPSEEWQEEIRKALDTMDFFISLHTEGFSSSVWCQQEVGYAVSRGVKIIPIKFNENPSGFIGKIQALNRGKKTAEQVVIDTIAILKESEKTRDLFPQKIKERSTDIFEDIPF